MTGTKTRGKCPSCGGKRIWSIGTIPRRTKPNATRYKCSACARTFFKETGRKPRGK